MDHLEIARLLDTHRPQIVTYAAAQILEDPFWRSRFKANIEERLLIDFDQNVATLAKSVRYRSPMILDDHMIWRRNQLLELGCSTGHIRAVFAHCWTGITQALPHEAQPTVYDYIQSAMYTLQYNNAAAQQLATIHNILAEEVVAATFDSHWHWQAAYGAEGRLDMLREVWFLIDYLADSLGTNSQGVLGRHTAWLRDTNLSRGLATTHMYQLLWLIAEGCERHLPPGPAEQARQMLERCSSYLVPSGEGVQALLAAQDALVAETAHHLFVHGLAPNEQQAALEVGWYMAYLSDSLARNDPAILAGYTRWMHQWLASQGLPDTPVRESFLALTNALARHTPQYVAHDSVSILRAAQQML